MAGEKQRVDAYLDTLGRMEPEIAAVDVTAGIASISISLKRIADALDRMAPKRDGGAPGTFGRVNQ